MPITFCAKRFVRNVLCESFGRNVLGSFFFGTTFCIWGWVLGRVKGLGWAGLGAGRGWAWAWAGLGWGAPPPRLLGWAGLGWAGLGWAAAGWAKLGGWVLGWAV